MNRRDFVKYASLTPLAGMIPAALASNPKIAVDQRNSKILLLVELRGGNDGLNTLIPSHQQQYFDIRPKLAVKAPKQMALDKGFHMNPYLKELKPLWDRGNMAWIQGVGYNHANRSHFHSLDVWNTGSPDLRERTGWLTRDVLPDTENVLNGIVVGDEDMGPFAGENSHAVAMENPRTFLRQTKYLNKEQYNAKNASLKHLLSTQNQINAAADLLQQRLHNSQKRHAQFPHSAFGRDLEQVTHLISSGVHLPVYKVTLGGFDTHAGQRDVHNNLMHQLGGGLASFEKAMRSIGLWNNVLVVTYSEFGRRVEENTSYGTDHGSASAHFVLGGQVRKGIYGNEPDLKTLDDGDLIPTVDFRQVYATIAQRWWRRPSPWGNKYRPLTFV